LITFADPRQTALIPTIIPFAPYNPEGCRLFVNSLISNINQRDPVFQNKKIIIRDPVKENIFKIILTSMESDRYVHMNYRGIEILFDDLVVYPLTHYIKTNPLNTQIVLVSDGKNIGVNENTKDAKDIL